MPTLDPRLLPSESTNVLMKKALQVFYDTFNLLMNFGVLPSALITPP
jgi:hypothetical protein